MVLDNQEIRSFHSLHTPTAHNDVFTVHIGTYAHTTCTGGSQLEMEIITIMMI